LIRSRGAKWNSRVKLPESDLESGAWLEDRIMRKWALCLLMTALAAPCFPVERVTVDQLEKELATTKAKSDPDVAKQLSGLELTERLSPARLQQLKSGLPGERAQAALIALADSSAFLDPPAAEIPATATPDLAAQRRMMALTMDYLGKTLPLLPNLLAERDTLRLENKPSQSDSSLPSENPLRPTGKSRSTVVYRDGQEYMDAGASKDNRPQDTDKGLTTWGEFGPILGTVMIDAARSKLVWSHWELNPAGPEAVFHYSVPKEKSHYDVRFCCVAQSYGMEIDILRQRSGYHGEITLDPDTGTILRLTVVADLTAESPISRASIEVEYGPVEIGGKTYVCPVRGIAVAEAPDLKAMHDMLFPPASAAGGPQPVLKNASLSSIAQVPRQTMLNDIAFKQYHLFRSEARMVASGESEQAALHPSAPPAAAAGETPSTPNFRPAAEVAMQGLAPSAAGATEAASVPPQLPATVPTPEPQIPEFSVSPATSLPNSAALPRPSGVPDSGFTLRLNSRLVDVGLVALDKKDRPITDLKPEEIEIFDNGQKQDLRFFVRAEGESANRQQDQSPQPAATSAQPAFSNRPLSVAGAANPPTEGNTTILLLDAANLVFGDLVVAREEMLHFLRDLPANERAALYVLKFKSFQVLEEGTTDHALLIDKLTKYKPDSLDVSESQDQEARNRQQMETVENMEDLLNVNGFTEADPGSNYTPLDASLRTLGSNPGRDSMAMLVNVARHLATIPGHKSLVWITSDNVLADWTRTSVTIDKGSKFIEAAALRAQEAMNDAHVSVYPLDASRLEAGVIDASVARRNVELNPTNQMVNYPLLEQAMQGPEFNADGAINPQPQRDLSPGRLTAQMQQDTHAIQGAFREVAEATGGRVFRRSSNISGELNGVVAEGRATYLLSFSPSQAADDKYHLLTVKVNGRPKINLRYRTGYLYSEKPQAIKDRFRQVVWQPEDAGEIALTADPASASSAGAVKLGIAANDLAMAQQGDIWADKLDIFLVKRDDAGMHAQVTGQILALRLKPETYQKVLRTGIPFDQVVENGPATGSLRIIVLDENSGRIGSVTVPGATLLAKK
jgi:VWFA-related protein